MQSSVDPAIDEKPYIIHFRDPADFIPRPEPIGTRFRIFHPPSPPPQTKEETKAEIQTEKKEENTESKRKFLADFEPDQLAEILKHAEPLGVKTVEELENFISSSEIIQHRFKMIYAIAIVLNIGYIGFIATRGGTGLKLAMEVLGFYISQTTSLGIGITVGILDTLMFILLFDHDKEASKTTVDFGVWRMKPISERLQEFFSEAYRQPHKFVYKLGLLLFNSASMMTVLLGLVELFPLPLLLALTPFVLIIGNFYMKVYSNAEADDGVKYFGEGGETLFGDLKRGKVSMVISILLKSLSMSILSAFPLFYNIGIDWSNLFNLPAQGSQVFAILLSLATFMRGLLVFHTITAKHYREPEKQLHELLKQIHGGDKATPEEYADMIKKLEKQILSEQGIFKLMTKEPADFIQFLFRITAGIFISSKGSSVTNIVSALFCFIFALTGAKANFDREKILAEIEKLRDKKTDDATQSDWEKWVRRFALLLAINSAASDSISVLGSLNIPNSSLGLSFLAAATDRLLSTSRFNYKKVEENLVSVARTKLTHFKPAPTPTSKKDTYPEVVIEIHESPPVVQQEPVPEWIIKINT